MNGTSVNKLIGRWTTNPNDRESIEMYGHVTIEFTDKGNLIYTIHGENKDEKIFLNYDIREGKIITNQSSAPKIEESPFILTENDELIIIYGGQKARYVRER